MKNLLTVIAVLCSTSISIGQELPTDILVFKDKIPVVVRSEIFLTGKSAEALMSFIRADNLIGEWHSEGFKKRSEIRVVPNFELELTAYDESTSLRIRCRGDGKQTDSCEIVAQYKSLSGGLGGWNPLVSESLNKEIVASLSERTFPGVREHLFKNIRNFRDVSGAAGPSKVVDVELNSLKVTLRCYVDPRNGDCSIALKLK